MVPFYSSLQLQSLTCNASLPEITDQRTNNDQRSHFRTLKAFGFFRLMVIVEPVTALLLQRELLILSHCVSRSASRQISASHPFSQSSFLQMLLHFQVQIFQGDTLSVTQLLCCVLELISFFSP
ncbi:hypothetical protein CMV_015235 [Castanea mollissima]|uniref:Uncharacterized protein n=1 Tax=Castanea mollissima TaxID=60419 RepID=A0A8J4QVZ6_9ROSI|nr:hypothetical protein CMV_015235 [Castanea mollissima]